MSDLYISKICVYVIIACIFLVIFVRNLIVEKENKKREIEYNDRQIDEQRRKDERKKTMKPDKDIEIQVQVNGTFESFFCDTFSEKYESPISSIFEIECDEIFKRFVSENLPTGSRFKMFIWMRQRNARTGNEVWRYNYLPCAAFPVEMRKNVIVIIPEEEIIGSRYYSRVLGISKNKLDADELLEEITIDYT